MPKSFHIRIDGSCSSPWIAEKIMNTIIPMMEDGKFDCFDWFDFANSGLIRGWKAEFNNWKSPTPMVKIEDVLERMEGWEEQMDRQDEQTFMADWKRMKEASLVGEPSEIVPLDFEVVDTPIPF